MAKDSLASKAPADSSAKEVEEIAVEEAIEE